MSPNTILCVFFNFPLWQLNVDTNFCSGVEKQFNEIANGTGERRLLGLQRSPPSLAFLSHVVDVDWNEKFLVVIFHFTGTIPRLGLELKQEEVFTIIDTRKLSPTKFVSEIIQRFRAIKYYFEYENQQQLLCLDVLVIRNANTLEDPHFML